jgi:hypothetical protein
LLTRHSINSWVWKPLHVAPARVRDATPAASPGSQRHVSPQTEDPYEPRRLQLVPEPAESTDNAHTRSISHQRGDPRPVADQSEESPTAYDDIERDLLEFLRPVDWASLPTLVWLTGITYDRVMHYLRRLEHQGEVGIGQRLVPPEMRTVAWLTGCTHQARRPSSK